MLTDEFFYHDNQNRNAYLPPVWRKTMWDDGRSEVFQMFLTKEELRQLTGMARKAGQIVQLRKMGIAFYINASNEPIVAKVTIEGGVIKNEAAKKWSPKALGT